MDRNVEMLNSIYQNASMASQSIETLLPKVDYPDLNSSLSHQQSVYNSIASHASQLLYDYDNQPKDTNPIERAALWAGVQLNSLFDSSPSHIAQMVIDGSKMGVTDMSKRMMEYYGCDKPVEGLANELMTYEQASMEELKRFL